MLLLSQHFQHSIGLQFEEEQKNITPFCPSVCWKRIRCTWNKRNAGVAISELLITGQVCFKSFLMHWPNRDILVSRRSIFSCIHAPSQWLLRYQSQTTSIFTARQRQPPRFSYNRPQSQTSAKVIGHVLFFYSIAWGQCPPILCHAVKWECYRQLNDFHTSLLYLYDLR